MKILLVTNKFNLGGAETHILELALALKDDGHIVKVASSGGIYELILRQNGIEHIFAPLDSKEPSCVIESYNILKKCIKKDKYDEVIEYKIYKTV